MYEKPGGIDLLTTMGRFFSTEHGFTAVGKYHTLEGDLTHDKPMGRGRKREKERKKKN